MTWGKRQERYPFKVGDNNTGQCSVCMEVFYGEAAFDRHRRDTPDGDRYCVDPADPPAGRTGKALPFWLDKQQRWHFGKRNTAWTTPDHRYVNAQGCENPSPGVLTTPHQVQALTDGISA